MKTEFIRIKRSSFQVGNQETRELRFRILQVREARKFWKQTAGQRQLLCHSADGIRSRRGEFCDSCPDHDCCQPKLRLYFRKNGRDLCLELPKSSLENYQDYSRGLKVCRMNIHETVTIARVVDQGYWGEVTFVPET